MIRKDLSFVCAACDICKQAKEAHLMCTYVVDHCHPSGFEEVCWCVCDDCLPIIEKVDHYYENLIDLDCGS